MGHGKRREKNVRAGRAMIRGPVLILGHSGRRKTVAFGSAKGKGIRRGAQLVKKFC